MGKTIIAEVGSALYDELLDAFVNCRLSEHGYVIGYSNYAEGRKLLGAFEVHTPAEDLQRYFNTHRHLA